MRRLRFGIRLRFTTIIRLSGGAHQGSQDTAWLTLSVVTVHGIESAWLNLRHLMVLKTIRFSPEAPIKKAVGIKGPNGLAVFAEINSSETVCFLPDQPGVHIVDSGACRVPRRAVRVVGISQMTTSHSSSEVSAPGYASANRATTRHCLGTSPDVENARSCWGFHLMIHRL